MTAISMAGNIHKLLSFMTERNITMKNTMKKLAFLLLVIAALLALSACGSKDAVAGTWTGDLGADGVVTWTFDGKGGCTMENPAMKQKGTYSLEGDQMTVQLENWDAKRVYTISVNDSSLTMNDNEGVAISGTYTKK